LIVVFSFFKKKDAEPAKAEVKPSPRVVPIKAAVPQAPVQQASAAKPATPPPAAQELVSLDFSTLGPTTLSGGGMIEVLDSSDVISVAMEQAAISYANEQSDDAMSILAEDVQSIEGHHALDTWLMLFDLYQIHGKRSEFDELALKFVVEFERSAPVWQELGRKKDIKPTPAKAGGPSVLFPAKMLGSAVTAPLDQIEKLGVGGDPVRLEFSRVTEIDSEAADLIIKRWPKFKKAKLRFLPAGGPQLAELLRGHIEIMRPTPAEVPYWLLLLEVYQLLGLQEDFENTAVDYAVTYEVSPPSWDTAAKTKTAEEVAKDDAKLKAESPQPAPSIDAYAFTGQVVGASESHFQGLLAYAESHNVVCIDFSQVPRVDFVSCGMLMNALVTITSHSKQAVIINANELIVALFRIMGVADVAKIVRKK